MQGELVHMHLVKQQDKVHVAVLTPCSRRLRHGINYTEENMPDRKGREPNSHSITLPAEDLYSIPDSSI